MIGRALAQARRWLDGDPFSLGVASGAPRPDGFVLWTRLAPDPLSADPATPGGMTGGDVAVGYEIASDPGNARHRPPRRRDGRGRPMPTRSMPTLPASQPGRPYWYRFLSGEAASTVGRAMTTARAPERRSNAMRFGFVSCSQYEHGYFSAYRHLADETPMPCCSSAITSTNMSSSSGRTVRTHSDGIEAATLPTYRNRYAQYRLDADLQRLHAAAPALVTWDDHEVPNDYADRWSQFYDDPRAVSAAARRRLPGLLRAHAGAADPVASRTGR